MELMRQTSHMSGGNVHYVEDLYEQYLNEPTSIPDEWRGYFDQLPAYEGAPSHDIPLAPVREEFYNIGQQRRTLGGGSSSEGAANKKQVRVLQLINAYRFRGHPQSDIDPLGLRPGQR